MFLFDGEIGMGTRNFHRGNPLVEPWSMKKCSLDRQRSGEGAERQRVWRHVNRTEK